VLTPGPLAALLLLALAQGGDPQPPADAGDEPPSSPGRTPEQPPPAAAEGANEPPGDRQQEKEKEKEKEEEKKDAQPAAPPERPDNWIDVGHAFIEQRVFAPILRLDRFFSDERSLDAERSRSFVRWRNQVFFTEDASRPIFATGLHANLRLPGLNQQLRRLRIVIAGETRDALQNLFPRTPGTSSVEEDTLGAANAGLRFYFLDTLFSHADLGAGVLTRIPPGVYGQVRFRTAVPVKRLFLTRQVLAGFWRTDTRFGTSVGLELERPITPSLVSRINGAATLTELSHGIEWGGEAALFTTLDERTAAQLGASVNGASRPALASDAVTRPPDLDRVRVFTRLRRDVFRRWIFVELEPELAFPWSLEKRRHSAWGVTFRLEVQFQGTEAPPPPPPEDPPEPRDPPP
jgi:hypothetical protein